MDAFHRQAEAMPGARLCREDFVTATAGECETRVSRMLTLLQDL
jgi:hypothetical protein